MLTPLRTGRSDLLTRFSPRELGFEAPEAVLELFKRLSFLFAELAAESPDSAPTQPNGEELVSASLSLATPSWGGALTRRCRPALGPPPS